MVSDRVAQVERILDGVMDPELPFLTITELGMIQGCDLDEDGTVVIKLTPTYSGCPATDAIQDDIKSALQPVEPRFRIDIVHAPAWTTDWISPEAREKMRLNGIAPPKGQAPTKPSCWANPIRCLVPGVRARIRGWSVHLAQPPARRITSAMRALSLSTISSAFERNPWRISSVQRA